MPYFSDYKDQAINIVYKEPNEVLVPPLRSSGGQYVTDLIKPFQIWNKSVGSFVDFAFVPIDYFVDNIIFKPYIINSVSQNIVSSEKFPFVFQTEVMVDRITIINNNYDREVILIDKILNDHTLLLRKVPSIANPSHFFFGEKFKIEVFLLSTIDSVIKTQNGTNNSFVALFTDQKDSVSSYTDIVTASSNSKDFLQRSNQINQGRLWEFKNWISSFSFEGNITDIYDGINFNVKRNLYLGFYDIDYKSFPDQNINTVFFPFSLFSFTVRVRNTIDVRIR